MSSLVTSTTSLPRAGETRVPFLLRSLILAEGLPPYPSKREGHSRRSGQGMIHGGMSHDGKDGNERIDDGRGGGGSDWRQISTGHGTYRLRRTKHRNVFSTQASKFHDDHKVAFTSAYPDTQLTHLFTARVGPHELKLDLNIVREVLLEPVNG